MNYRNGYPRQWFREPRRFNWSILSAYLVCTALCALVWIAVGYVAWWML